jgi:hypothetical protein
LLGTRAGNGELLAKAAIAAIRAGSKAGLRLNGFHTGLQRRQIRPTAAVQGQLAHRGFVDGGADVGTAELHRRRLRGYLHAVRNRSHMHDQVKGLLRADRHGDAGFYFGVETFCGNRNFIASRQEIHRRIKAVGIRGYRAFDAGGNVLDDQRRLRHAATRRVGDGAGERSSRDLRERWNGKEDSEYQKNNRLADGRIQCRSSLKGH